MFQYLASCSVIPSSNPLASVKPPPKKMSTSTLYRYRDELEDSDLRTNSRRISLRAPPPPNLVNVPRYEVHFHPSDDSFCQHPVLTIPPGRAADWHQRIGTYENLPPPKHVAHRKNLPQPVWELRLNPDYGTLPGIPLLEALQGVGAVGADMPAYAERLMKLNIYVSPSLPA